MPPPRPSTGSAVVAVRPVEDDVRRAVREAMEAVGWTEALPAGKPVALKVNLGWDLFIPGSITSPMVAEAVILELRRHAGRVVVVEADQVLEDIERAFRRSGMAEVCRRTGAEWVNMTRAPMDVVDHPENVVLRRVEIPRILREMPLVTLPVMKTHAKTVLSGALKNQWGCLNKMRHEYHLVLDDALADLNSIVRPALAVMDATVALEGNGPKSGTPRFVDRVLCSTDPVALDTVQAILMSIPPAEVAHLARCAARGVGCCDRSRIEVRGTRPEDEPVPFARARHNAVSAVETLLRKSLIKRLVFDTPLFHACLVGAKVYYHGWTAARAAAHWRRVRAHPLYGPQWRPGWPGLEATEREAPPR